MRLIHEKNLLEIFQASIKAVNGRFCVQQYLANSSQSYPTHIVAIGKAASSMMLGALDYVGQDFQQGLVITGQGHLDATLEKIPNIKCLESSHPVPDIKSLEAGTELLHFITEAPKDARFLFLISGGTSSLVEVLPDGISLTELQKLNTWLLASGLDIHQVNEIRQSVSLIKGGRLVDYLEGRPALVLLISDVIGDNPAVIGSGLLVNKGDKSQSLEREFPDWINKLMQVNPQVMRVSEGNIIDVHVIASIQDALQAALRQSDDMGYHTVLHSKLLSGDAIETGKRLTKILLAEDGSGSVIHIWGGETTVRLPDVPGNGGRSQSLALAVAQQIKDDNGIALLAVGTDGIDGSGEDAGALVDSDTIMRGECEHFDAQDCLDRADAGSFLQASGDLIHTGSTGTNVMDLVIGLKA